MPLLDAIQEHQFDAAFGGGRRDEEKARAKERFFSHRDRFGQWDPKNQRPELWHLYNGHKNVGEHFRVFPLSNWTEMDVWQYIALEDIAIPNLYFAHEREVFERRRTILAKTDFMELLPGEELRKQTIRFRTIGDATCTGAVEQHGGHTPGDHPGGRRRPRDRARRSPRRQALRGGHGGPQEARLFLEGRGDWGAGAGRSSPSRLPVPRTQPLVPQTQTNGMTTNGTNGTAPEASGDAGDDYLEMDLLRFTTAGSVDDGKSTLIGRLLYDTKSIFQDQMDAVEEASRSGG